MGSWWADRSIWLGALVSVAGVAAVTLLIYALREVMPVQAAGVVYVLPVVFVSTRWGLRLGLATALLSVLAFGFFHLPPTGSLTLSSEEDWVALAVFLAVAFVTSGLAQTSRTLTDEQEALRRVATEVARAPSPSEIFTSVTREVGLRCRADLARLERYEVDGTVTGVAAWSRDEGSELATGTRLALQGISIAAQVRETGGPVRVDSFAGASGPIAEEARMLGIRSSIGCPVVVRGRLWGVIAASSKAERAFPPETESQIGQFTELLATAIANADSREELVASRARILLAADEARRRIQRDLHDGAQQRLVHTVITLKLARRELSDGGPEVEELVDEAIRHAETATSELRELSHGLLPSVLTSGGLRAAVDSLVKRTSLPVTAEICGDRFHPGIEATAYFVVSEALTNSVKHSGAKRAAVKADADNGGLRVEIRDDGAGGAEIAAGTGLEGLQDRVVALDGRLQIESPLGGGTRIIATLPSASV
jgi:signal transduction histidine kinase